MRFFLRTSFCLSVVSSTYSSRSGQVEVGREALDDVAVEVPADRERVGLVGPADVVEVEDPRELGLARVGERRGRRRRRRPGRLGHAGSPAAAPRPAEQRAAGRRASRRGGGRTASTSSSLDGRRRPAMRAPGDRAELRRSDDGVEDRATRRRARHAARGSSSGCRRPRSRAGRRRGRRGRRGPRSGRPDTAAPHDVQPAPARSRPESAMVHRRSVYRRWPPGGSAGGPGRTNTPMGYHRSPWANRPLGSASVHGAEHSHFRHSYSKDKAQLVRRLCPASRARSAGSRG